MGGTCGRSGISVVAMCGCCASDCRSFDTETGSAGNSSTTCNYAAASPSKDADSHQDTNGYVDFNQDSNPDRNADTDVYQDTNAHTNGHADVYEKANVHTNGNANDYENSDENSDSHADRHTDKYANTKGVLGIGVVQ